MNRIPAPAVGMVVFLSLAAACESEKPKYEGPYAAQVSEAVPLIEKAVGLKFKTAPKLETRSKAQVREFITQQFKEPRAIRDLAGEKPHTSGWGSFPTRSSSRSSS